jgi:hypothetical protein
MAFTVKQSNPAATTDTNLYTVPAATEAVISTLAVANLGGADASFRVAVRPAGAAIANQHYLAYETTVSAGDSKFFTIGIALAATDVLTVRASAATVAFTAFVNETAA